MRYEIYEAITSVCFCMNFEKEGMVGFLGWIGYIGLIYVAESARSSGHLNDIGY